MSPILGSQAVGRVILEMNFGGPRVSKIESWGPAIFVRLL
jgi:hypothetical protein